MTGREASARSRAVSAFRSSPSTCARTRSPRGVCSVITRMPSTTCAAVMIRFGPTTKPDAAYVWSSHEAVLIRTTEPESWLKTCAQSNVVVDASDGRTDPVSVGSCEPDCTSDGVGATFDGVGPTFEEVGATFDGVPDAGAELGAGPGRLIVQPVVSRQPAATSAATRRTRPSDFLTLPEVVSLGDPSRVCRRFRLRPNQVSGVPRRRQSSGPVAQDSGVPVGDHPGP